MNASDYSTLSFLATAVVSEPNKTDDFLAVLRGDSDISDIPAFDASEDLRRAIAGLSRQFEGLREETAGREVTLRDVILVAGRLAEAAPDDRVAASLLFTAAQELLASKRRAHELTIEDREILEDELPAAAASFG